MLSTDNNSSVSGASSKSAGWKQHLGCVHQKDPANQPIDQLQPTRGKKIRKPASFLCIYFLICLFIKVVDKENNNNNLSLDFDDPEWMQD